MKIVYPSVYLEDSTGEEFEVELEASIGYDGIGHFEFWGHKCFDLGNVCIEDVRCVNLDSLTPEQQGIVELKIEDGAFDDKILEHANEY
jgi:hypothetical protein